MERLTKTFKLVTFLSMTVTLLIATLSVMGIVFIGFYPGIVVLLFAALISIVSHWYSKKITSKSSAFQKNYYRTFTIINSLLILLVLYMTFVIVIDRVVPGIKVYIN